MKKKPDLPDDSFERAAFVLDNLPYPSQQYTAHGFERKQKAHDKKRRNPKKR